MKNKSYRGGEIFILLFSILIFSVGCKNSGSNPKKALNQEAVQTVETPQAVSGAVDDIMKRGEAVYADACLVCHQTDGSGVPMMFPPIKGSEIVAGNHEKLIKIVLNGMSGPVEIKGDKYDSEMPPQRDNLSDKQIADLLTYIRNSFGNKGDTIKEDEVAVIRK
jgi:mono/diheme cytochrome c family protein